MYASSGWIHFYPNCTDFVGVFASLFLRIILKRCYYTHKRRHYNRAHGYRYTHIHTHTYTYTCTSCRSVMQHTCSCTLNLVYLIKRRGKKKETRSSDVRLLVTINDIVYFIKKIANFKKCMSVYQKWMYRQFYYSR